MRGVLGERLRSAARWAYRTAYLPRTALLPDTSLAAFPLLGRLDRLLRRWLKTRMVSVDGFAMTIDERDSLQLTSAGFEPMETAVLKRCIPEAWVALDVGANIGYYTLQLSRLVGPAGWVVAYEPDPTNFSILSTNVRRNGCANVALEPKAAANAKGIARFYLSSTNTGDHALYTNAPDRAGIDVVTVRLDDETEIQRRPVNFIKMDIQGTEIFALEGMPALVERDQPVIMMEFDAGLIRRCGRAPLEPLRFLEQRGYALHRLARARIRLIRTTSEDLVARFPESSRRDINVFALPSGPNGSPFRAISDAS